MITKKVLIIAEAGVNHNGDFELALKLIDAAKEAGADFVKFQTFKAEKLVSKNAKKANYQRENLKSENDSQFDMLKKLEMSDEWHDKLIKYSNSVDIGFMSSGFDEDSNDFLEKLGVKIFKVPSGEIINKRYLQNIGKKGKMVILSTGMADLVEVKDAMSVLVDVGLPKSKIIVLHCNTEYPTPLEDVNLLAMNHLREELGCEIGYSDHTNGIEVPVAAVALGASVIEKHFTLDRNMIGPDHIASLEPKELKQMVDAIRKVEISISGSGYKIPSASELKNKVSVRKSLHFAKDLKCGFKLLENSFISLRPGSGISPMLIDELVGRVLRVDVCSGQMIKWEDLL